MLPDWVVLSIRVMWKNGEKQVVFSLRQQGKSTLSLIIESKAKIMGYINTIHVFSSLLLLFVVWICKAL